MKFKATSLTRSIKLLSLQLKNKRKKTQITNIRNKGRDITPKGTRERRTNKIPS